ncbi:MAG: Crp/Fnr family transcriptional regulator [Solirubrobacterales bacterium]
MARGRKGRRGRRSDPKIERLSNVSLFSGCSNRELKLIAGSAEELDIAAGKTLMRQGDPGRECFVIVDGKATAKIRGKGTYPMGPGTCFGEMSLLDNELRSATVTADTDMRVLVLSSRDFSRLVSSVPTVALRVMASLAQRIRDAERVQPHH